ncbi:MULTISPECIES: epipeptide YydF family RiPP [Heyndrickxia]|jgi:YydF family exported signaling peptide|uniref:Exported signaling peptide, YydF/SAG_2028 family n=1 Tax=Heyndrickxia coagulans DSM 1 = ATCC 7050 TaxID=1121088 RepID=A0A8B4BUL0_HEYCO|nr:MULTISPECIES: epipeptide YydF family RiPP [Heyndrickxia]AJH79071.1 exported signaling peptide, YydF/ family protein [Heyndrickxia coagulans DSM 1 = ATCC 7050]KGT37354.1 sugar tyrosine-protein kinase [Heyndrickxia coagulans P38]MCR2846798.1 epipeptide YydF family RiPP [Heyndrickxia coagulans]MDR4224925.1 YydF family exported signaling peptide [Heyndrickxia coagulans DSM 1 = ATCC 7050]MED4494756.1 epipeptide YydF family RiPP [Heyndrickxia coagulans]
MSKENTQNSNVKNLEFKSLVEESQKLAKVNDLWYFVKSKGNRWIVGSGH